MNIQTDECIGFCGALFDRATFPESDAWYQQNKIFIDAEYIGYPLRWTLADGNKKGVYCRDCGNIANGVVQVVEKVFNFNIPLCKRHLSEIPELKSTFCPCFERISKRI